MPVLPKWFPTWVHPCRPDAGPHERGLHLAGIGNDPRNRRFNTVSQGEKYDADAALIAAWVPELAGLPAEQRHRPWTAEPHPSQYPSALVDVVTQVNRVRQQ